MFTDFIQEPSLSICVVCFIRIWKNNYRMQKISHILVLFASIMIAACGDKEDDTNPDFPQVIAASISRFEGNENGSFELKVRLTQAADKVVTLDFATKDKSAKAGEDYVATSGSLSFAAGEIEKIVAVSIIADTLKEPDEEFELLLTNPTNAVITGASAIGTIRNDDTFQVIPDDGYSTPESYSGYTLVWQDEFNGTTIDPTNWVHETGASGWGNNELQYYTARPENSFISDGKLVIEAKKENYQGAPYTSARMKTAGLREFKYGRIDIRAKLPKGQGIWPALWMLGGNFGSVGWPKCGEIDIMEVIGSEPAKLHGTVHWDNNGSHAQYGQSTTLPSGTFADEFHVFTIIWDNQKIRWLLDDVQFNVVDIASAGLSEFHNEFFFIFNIAVGGNWPGNPDATTVFPQQMVVDYVRVFQE